jgi:putative addiction module component (TIGR02574 family)
MMKGIAAARSLRAEKSLKGSLDGFIRERYQSRTKAGLGWLSQEKARDSPAASTARQIVCSYLWWYHIHPTRLLLEYVMAAILKEIESQALQLSPPERGELIHRLIVSLEAEPEDSPEVIAKAWDEEIARRVADMEAGRTRWTPADEVMAQLRTKISAAKAGAGQS